MSGLRGSCNCRSVGVLPKMRMMTTQYPPVSRPSRSGPGHRSRVRFAGLLCLGALLGTPSSGGAQVDIRIAAYNIRHGRGVDDRVDLPRIADVLRSLDADVITLQEVDDRTERTDGVDQVQVLAELLGYEGVHGPHRPYQGGFYGNAVLTRLPIRGERTRAIPPASGSALAVHEVEVVLSDQPLSTLVVVSVHLAGSEDERMAQADSVTSHFDERASPVILAGDFNGRPESLVLDRLARDWVILAKDGSPLTYPSGNPDREIDFVMIRPADPIQIVSHSVVPEAVASDHRPLIAELRIR